MIGTMIAFVNFGRQRVCRAHVHRVLLLDLHMDYAANCEWLTNLYVEYGTMMIIHHRGCIAQFGYNSLDILGR